NDQALLVHPEVLEFDIELQKLSADEEKQLAKLSESEIADLQAEFLAQAAPMHSFGAEGGKSGGKHMQKTKITTFELTAMLLEKKMPLKEMAAERGMTVETIIKHIETLIEDGTIGGTEDVAYLKKEISFAHFKKIEEALAEVAEAQNANLSDEEKDAGAAKPPLLSPVKSKLSASISFKEIQLARILLGYIQKKK
ncbi:MAG: hypothetical protein JWO73_265, partial [Candidatus Taylorbacteria bacterium]|nr:hypothetical protein [Candidatus Taylorbacteria bacterium]